MIFAIDFDGTIVVQDGRRYDDLETPLEFMPGAEDALRRLKAEGHILLLWSGRASPALRKDPMLNPLVAAGVVNADLEHWYANRELNEARYQQMVEFVEDRLPGIFDAIDDGTSPSKPLCDVMIDDKAMRFGAGFMCVGWKSIVAMYGDPTDGLPFV